MFRCMSCWQLGISVRTLSRICESLFPRCEAVTVFLYHIYTFGGREVNERWCDHIYSSVIEISCVLCVGVCISVLKENESKGVIVLQIYNAWHLSDYKMLKHYAIERVQLTSWKAILTFQFSQMNWSWLVDHCGFYICRFLYLQVRTGTH